MIKRYLDKILISLGCIIIATAILLKINTMYKKNELIKDYKEAISNMEEEDKSFHEEKENAQIDMNQNQKQEGNIIGILTIPKIDLSVGIVEGVDNETLKYSVGHFSETAMPGQKGNFCVIGHRSYSYGEFFNRLDELEKNDLLVIERNNHKFKYKITEIKVVLPTELSVLNQTEDTEITLITCTPIRVGSHRLIVKGVLEND